MDPISAVTIANYASGIAVNIVTLIQFINGVVQQYKGAALGIRTVATQCASYRIAVVRVTKWLSTQTQESQAELEPDFWVALRENLETGASVIMSLEKEIRPLARKKKLGFGSKTSFIWNSDSIALFQNQIQGLMSSISMLISVIDMPNLEAKRSQMEAQKPRLKTISKSVKESEIKREELRARHPVNMLVNLDIEDDFSELSPPLTLQSSASEQRPDQSRSSTTDTTYTSYSSASEVSQNNSEYAKAANTNLSASNPNLTEVVATVAKSIKEPKEVWKSMMPKLGRTISDQLMQTRKPREMNLQANRQQDDKQYERAVSHERNSDVHRIIERPMVVSPQPVQTRAKGDHNVSRAKDEELEYFDLQQAMSGMSLGYGVDDFASNDSYAEPRQHQPLEVPLHRNSATDFEDTHGQFETEHKVSVTTRGGPREKKRPIYGTIKEGSSETNIRRIRPSQRVGSTIKPNDELDANSELGAQTPPPPPYSTYAPAASTEDLSNDLESEQVWITNTISRKESKFKVQFSGQAFTNKMSRAAARLLGVENHAIHYAGQTMVNLTLLYLTDGESSSVVGEEVEFELLSEFNNRASTFVLGTAHLHLRQIMAEGEYVYWNPGPIPEKLRDHSRLRLLRRFELVRW